MSLPRAESKFRMSLHAAARPSIGILVLAILVGCAAPHTATPMITTQALPSGIAVQQPAPDWTKRDRVKLEFVLPPDARPLSWPGEPYQSVQVDGRVCRVELKRVKKPQLSLLTTMEWARGMQATRWIQSAHPEIRDRAQAETIGARDSPRESARRLAAWVRSHMNGRPVEEPIADALQTLRTGDGDCTEHALLLCALSRAVGIPSRMVAGLRYRDGRMRFHAWSELHIQWRWTPIDTKFHATESLPPKYFALGYEYGDNRDDAPYVSAILSLARVKSMRVKE